VDQVAATLILTSFMESRKRESKGQGLIDPAH
jgi:hypothetical protein